MDDIIIISVSYICQATERTAIHYASLAGHTEIIDVLLTHGSALHFTDKVQLIHLQLMMNK